MIIIIRLIFYFILINVISIETYYYRQKDQICILNNKNFYKNSFDSKLMVCLFERCDNEFSYKCGLKYCASNAISCTCFYGFRKRFKIFGSILQTIKFNDEMSRVQYSSILYSPKYISLSFKFILFLFIILYLLSCYYFLYL